MKIAVTTALAAGLALAAAGQSLDLDDRIARSVARLADTTRQPAFDRAFVLADVALDRDDPRRFANFSGDLSGRYLEVMSLVGDEAVGLDLSALTGALLAYQQPDGRFGDPQLAFAADEIGGEHMALLWGNGRLLVGLMAYHAETGDPQALAAATRLGDFFIGTAEACRQPAVVARLEGFGAKGIICFTQYIEGLVMLAGATGEPRFEQAARDAYVVLPPRGVQHAHGYLSTLRGALQLYELTGDEAVLAYVRTTFDDLLDSDDHNLFGAVYEYFGGQGDSSGGAHAATRDEGCASADFCRLALHLHEVTGEERYFAAGERALVNALFYNQYPSGDFGHHFIEDGVLAAANPRRSWWCCTMHGLRALLEVRDRYGLVATADGAYEQRLLVPGTYVAGEVSSRVEAPTQIGEGRFRQLVVIEGCGASPLEMHVRPAAWAEYTAATPSSGEYPCGAQVLDLTPELRFSPGVSRASATIPDSTEAGYLTYGPYVLGVRETDFVAEPDWANAVALSTRRPGGSAYSLKADFRHSGYPGLHPVELVPIASQMRAGHPYMRIATGYGEAVRVGKVD